MAFPLFSPSSTILRLGLGVGLGISAATLHPLSPFRAAPMQCQYNAPYAQSGAGAPWAVKPEESLLQKQGRTGLNQARGFMTKENMRQVSLGSVLGLVAGVGLRAFSKALVVILGMGVVFIEVCYTSLLSIFAWFFAHVKCCRAIDGVYSAFICIVCYTILSLFPANANQFE